MSRTYYGGYFGRCVEVVPNPCNPFWGKIGYYDSIIAFEKERKAELEAKQKPDSAYKQYLHRVLIVFREAMYRAKSDREYWHLNERVHYYFTKWDSAD